MLIIRYKATALRIIPVEKRSDSRAIAVASNTPIPPGAPGTTKPTTGGYYFAEGRYYENSPESRDGFSAFPLVSAHDCAAKCDLCACKGEAG